MKLVINRRVLLSAMGALAVMRPSLSAAGEMHVVQMLNKHPEDKKKRMIFHPLIQSVEPGDTVKFTADDKGHNSVSVDGMIPDGVEGWDGKINQEIEVTFEKPGIYGYRCTPHTAMGMVGLIIVRGDGMADNLEAAKAVRQRGRAKKVWEEIWAQVEAENLLA